jgi:hypothetical protein
LSRPARPSPSVLRWWSCRQRRCPRSTRHVAKIGFGVVPQSVNCDRIVCRISMGLEHSLRPRPAHPVVPMGSRQSRLGVRLFRSRKACRKECASDRSADHPRDDRYDEADSPEPDQVATSVPRLAEKSMFGLWSMKAIVNDGAPIRFLRADRVTGFSLEIRTSPFSGYDLRALRNV